MGENYAKEKIKRVSRYEVRGTKYEVRGTKYEVRGKGKYEVERREIDTRGGRSLGLGGSNKTTPGGGVGALIYLSH